MNETDPRMSGGSDLTLSPKQAEQLDAALRSAFHSKTDFMRLARYGLGEHLLEIVEDGALRDIRFRLIQWAEAHSRINELIQSALALRSQDSSLRSFARSLGLTALEEPPASVDDGEVLETRVQRIQTVFQDPPPPLDPPARGKVGVLIDVSHGQMEWQSSLFRAKTDDVLRALGATEQSARWHLQRIERSVQIDAALLKQWSGLIFGLPYHIRLEEETHFELVKWVRQGGRLVLLGFELGERHHETNLNELASEFGLRFNSDIVAPKGWNNQQKPYGEPIDFVGIQSSQPHSMAASGAPHLLDGVSSLRLWNLCTLTVEPGADFLLTLGEHAIGWLQKEGVSYSRRGVLRSWNQRFTLFKQADWVPVIAEAPRALTGKGSVLAIGTWELFTRQGDFPAGFDNQRFLANLLDWCGSIPT